MNYRITAGQARWPALFVVFLATVAVSLWGQVRSDSKQDERQGYEVPAVPPQSPRQLPGGPYVPEDPRWSWWREMKKRDPRFEWKMPVNFYGRIIDQDGIGVEGARVVLNWTNESVRGTGQRVIRSSRDGYFSLEGVRGKRLLVTEISKDGYVLDRGDAPFSFEYAAFFEETYFEPSRERPVVYRLRHALKPSALWSREGEVKLVDGAVAKIGLWNGESLELDLADPAEAVRRNVDWLLEVRLAGGGVQCTTDDVMVRAPAEDYAPQVGIGPSTPKPARWVSIYDGTRLYFRTADEHYGWVELRGMVRKRFMRFTLVVNPERGSRALGHLK